MRFAVCKVVWFSINLIVQQTVILFAPKAFLPSTIDNNKTLFFGHKW